MRDGVCEADIKEGLVEGQCNVSVVFSPPDIVNLMAFDKANLDRVSTNLSQTCTYADIMFAVLISDHPYSFLASVHSDIHC